MGLRSASSPSPPPFLAGPTTATPKFPLIPGLPRPSPAMWDSILSAVRTRDDKYHITSPNCKFVPEPLVGRVVVALRADYRYGPTDPIQWPQITAAKWEYLSVIRRGMPSNDPRAVMWADPPERDFEVIQGCQFTSLGLFKKSSIHSLLAQARDIDVLIARRHGTPPAHLTWLAAALRQGCDRLARFPSTRRDACLQFRDIQRYWLMATAHMEYFDLMKKTSKSKHTSPRVRLDFMGAFTTHPHVVQNLYGAGIPVWFIRPDASVKGLHLSTTPAAQPSSLCTDYGPLGGHVLYAGLSGTQHLQTCAPGNPRYFDISHAPLIASYTVANYSTPPTDNRHAPPTASSPSSTRQSSRLHDPRMAIIYGEQPPVATPCEYCAFR